MALNQQIFLQRSKLKHGEKYNYDQAIYTTLYEKVKLICSIHGSFMQVAANHMAGNGCPKCGTLNANLKKKGKKCPRKTPLSILTQQFIDKAHKIHKDVYNYTNTVFTNWKEKVQIECLKHGTFFQVASDHVHGKNGCPECGLIKRGLKRKLGLTTDSFVKKANEIHNRVYDYTKTKINSSTYSTDKIPIICKWHGVFYQSIRLHLKGHGCKKCAHEYVKGVSRRALNSGRNCNVYLLELTSENEQFYKIGITTGNVESRICCIPYNIKILDIVTKDSAEAFNLEQKILQKYKKKRYLPLITFGGWSECFQELPSTVISEL